MNTKSPKPPALGIQRLASQSKPGAPSSPSSPGPSPSVGTPTKDGPRPKLSQAFAVCSQQGRRPYQEDRAASNVLDGELTAYGIFDGHGGDEVSQLLAGQMDFLGRLLVAVKAAISAGWPLVDALAHVYTSTHKELLARKTLSDTVGSCAVTAMVQQRPDKTYWVHVANSGDARCLIYNTAARTALRLSCDHKPELPGETARIEARGGVVLQGRLFCNRGATAVSRALGDRAFAAFGLVADPFVRSTRVGPSDGFLLLFSDGLTEQMTDDEVCSVVAAALAGGETPAQAAAGIVQRAMEHPEGMARNSNDNVTAMVVQFTWGVAAAGRSSGMG